MGERVPAAGSAFRRGAQRIASKEGADGALVGNDGGRVDAARRDVGISREDGLRFIERSRVMRIARRRGGLDECGGRVGKRGGLAGQAKRLGVLGEFRPACKAVLAGYDELRIGELEGRGANYVQRLVVEPRVITRNAVEGLGRGLATTVEKILGLLLILFEARLFG